MLLLQVAIVVVVPTKREEYSIREGRKTKVGDVVRLSPSIAAARGSASGN